MQDKSEEAFRTIREVADSIGVPTHVLRFWESKFESVEPVKGNGGRRYYRPEDMRLLGGIKQLLHVQGMTIRGVQKMILDEGPEAVRKVCEEVDFDQVSAARAPRRIIRHTAQGEMETEIPRLGFPKSDEEDTPSNENDAPQPTDEDVQTLGVGPEEDVIDIDLPINHAEPVKADMGDQQAEPSAEEEAARDDLSDAVCAELDSFEHEQTVDSHLIQAQNVLQRLASEEEKLAQLTPVQKSALRMVKRQLEALREKMMQDFRS